MTKVPAPDLDLSQPWYLILTAPRAEARAAKALTEAGCQVFWPHRSHHVEYGGKRKPLDFLSSTFPGYILASGEPMVRFRSATGSLAEGFSFVETGLSSIHDLDGVVGVVSNAGKWVELPKTRTDKYGKEMIGVVEAIAAYQNDAPMPEAEQPEDIPFVAAGQTVRLLSGPFMGFMATMVEAIGLDKARVAIDAFGRETMLDLPVEQLEAA
ncbi:transcription termination/antitermination NusG family protein [Bosea sp. AS-1]|uniref:transcription termination/antitermination protein NusG n=1 Tax=Bosea sp. AS-1 TaxID=2015316 RepID=UPI0012FD4692|nr:transcription termination/antitermination NusG family protein [Bosea sp. AS-1]